MAAFFQGLGVITSAAAVSVDGSVVVGNLNLGGPFYWTQKGGLVPLRDSSGNTLGIFSKATGVSGDGSVIVGGNTLAGGQAFRWADGVAAAIPQLGSPLTSFANSVSQDGSIITGEQQTFSGFSGFVLSGATLQTISRSSLNLTPNGIIVSANGSVVAGNLEGGAGTSTPFQWQNGVLTQWPGPMGTGTAEGLSPDGSVIVGSIGVGNGLNSAPFEWANGVVTTLHLPTPYSTGSATGISNDGTTIVGWMSKTGLSNTAFIWNQASGVQELQKVLTADGLGSELAGWTLTQASAVTPDGNTIVGKGVDPQGQDEGWIATLTPIGPPPPPSQKQTPTITWNNPPDIAYGTALSDMQLDAVASVPGISSLPGTYSYTPSTGMILHAGMDQSLSVTFTPVDTTDYNTASASVSINVLRATPVIIWGNPKAIISGTPLSDTRLDAGAFASVAGIALLGMPIPGTFTYTPPAGKILPVGNNQTLSVTFAPTDTTDYTSANATVSISVLPAPGQAHGTSTILTATPGILNPGQQVSLTATVRPTQLFGGTPTGQVGFWDGSRLLRTAPLVRGRATLRTSSLDFGSNPIQATYMGDMNFEGSNSNIEVVIVNGARTVVRATSSPRPSSLRQSVRFTATVSVLGNGRAIPTGAIQFWNGPALLGMAPLNSRGRASIMTTALSIGTHTIRVAYVPDTGFEKSSTSLKQTVR
jgi:uncharacterized membrane protein